MHGSSMCCRLLGVSFVVGIIVHLAFAQGEGTLLYEVSHKTDYEKQHFRFTSLRDKGNQALSKEDLALMDLAAKYYIYRLTSYEAKQDSKLMHKFVSEFENHMDSAMRNAKTNPPQNPEFLKAFPKAAVARIKDVLDLDFNANRLACINTAMLLPSLAQTRQDVVADYLMQLLNDPKKHEVIKLYASKALKELPPARTYTDEDPPTDKALLAQKAREAARVNALLKMLDHKWPVDEKSPPDEAERERAAARFMRREVVAALASMQVPATTILSKKKTLEGPVAYGLIRVLAKDSMSPSASLAERCDAAVGLCYVKPPNLQYTKPEYQPHTAIFLIGRFLGDYVGEYQKDFPNRALKKTPYYPWKFNSERLLQGLEELKANLKYTPVDGSYVQRFQRMHEDAKDVLNRIKSQQVVEGNRANDLANSVGNLRPKGDEAIIFRSFKQQPKFDLP